METIIQTLTLAITLFIIGSICMAVGIVGLIWSAERKRRRIEK